MADQAQLDMLVAELKKRLGLTKYEGTLGDSDDDSVATVDEPGRPGYVRVRLYLDDVPYRTVKSGLLGGYNPYPGSPVIVGYDEKGDLAIEKADHDALIEANLNPLVNNAIDPRINRSRQTDELLPLWCGAISEEIGTASTIVSVNVYRYVDTSNIVHWFEGLQVDLAAQIPAANLHRYVAVFFRDDETIQVTASTPIALITPLQESDKQECFDARDVFTTPVWLWHLHDNQASITNDDKVEDLRPWFWLPDKGHITRTTAVTYNVVNADRTIFANTDGNAVTVNLQAGTQERKLRIVNTGTSAANVTIAPNGAEHLIGVNSNWILFDGEALIIEYDTTDGWY